MNQIFYENFLSRLVASPFPSVMLEAKYYFGQNVQTELCVAFSAILCAFLTNYYFGYALGLLQKYFSEKTISLFAKAKAIFSGRGRVVLLLAFLPFGNILLVAAGVLGLSFKQSAPFIIIAATLALVRFIL